MKTDQILNKTEIIRHFIADEDKALTERMQGDFFISYHYKIVEVAKKLPKDVTDEEIINLYYHLLRLNVTVPVQPETYPLFQRAFEKLLDILNERSEYPLPSKSSFRLLDAALLFNALGPEDGDHIYQTTFEDYTKYRNTLMQCNAYTSYPNMLDKYERFLPFANDTVVVNRACTALERISFIPPRLEATFWGLILILILNAEERAIKALNQFIKKTSPEDVWTLGNFLKKHSDKKEISLLLQKLYRIYPKEWIDEPSYGQPKGADSALQQLFISVKKRMY